MKLNKIKKLNHDSCKLQQDNERNWRPSENNPYHLCLMQIWNLLCC